MGAAQFKDFTPENISQNYDIVAKKIQQMKTASPAQLTGQVNLKPLSLDKITISNLTKDEISKLMQFLRPKVPESVPIQQTQTQIKFNLIAPQALGTQQQEIKDNASTAVKQAKQAAKQAKDALAQAKLAGGENTVTLIPSEISSKSFADKCKVFEQNHKINPFNKKRVGKYMKPNGYTETLLTNLCKDPIGFCSSKKANKFITNKYCKDIDVSDVVVKQQIQQAQQQVKQVQQQVRQQQQQVQQQIKQAQQQQQVQQQIKQALQQQQVQQQIKQALQQQQVQQQIKQPQQQQQIKQAQQQQLIEVTPSSEDILNDYYLQKCNAFKTNRSKNPFNKTNKGRHMVPTKYTQKLLDELCAGPSAFCDKHKGSKRISNKYCTEAPTVTQLKKDVSQQIQQIQQMIQQVPQVQQQLQQLPEVQQQQVRQQQVRQQQQQQQLPQVQQQVRQQQVRQQQVRQQQIKQAQQQQTEEEEESVEIFIPEETETQSVEESVASMFQKAQLGRWTEKCAQYAANPNKNPFNKTNRGKHFKPNNYTTHILDELCANPIAYCDKKKENKYISNKYCNL